MIDCAVHPQVPQNEILNRLSEPWRSRAFPTLHRLMYVHPRSDFHSDIDLEAQTPASDPRQLSRQLFTGDVARAILVPPARNLQPEPEMETAIAEALNDWLTEVWLTSDRRYLGSIRVCPRDPASAVREIERWAGHPSMVQISVPLQAHAPYGQDHYLPIWEAAAKHNLPVAVHVDPGSSIDFWPTPAGYPRHYIEYAVLVNLSFIYHLVNLIVEGVFDRLPNLRFVFVDGGFDTLMAFRYRLNMYWRSVRVEIPWVRRLPSEYLKSHVRFCLQKLEGPAADLTAEFLSWSDGEDICLFGSHFPYWYSDRSALEIASLPQAVRTKILRDNAATLYGLEELSPA